MEKPTTVFFFANNPFHCQICLPAPVFGPLHNINAMASPLPRSDTMQIHTNIIDTNISSNLTGTSSSTSLDYRMYMLHLALLPILVHLALNM